MAIHYAIAHDMGGLEGKRRYLLDHLEEFRRSPGGIEALHGLVSNFNRRAESVCRPELRIELAGFDRASPPRSPAPRPTPGRSWTPVRIPDWPAEPSHPILERLRSLWAEMRSTLFAGRLPEVRIVLDRRDDRRLGTFSRKAAEVWINPAILDGTHKAVRGGSGDQLGLVRFAGDVLAHEAIHAHEADFLGLAEGHNGSFHAKCVELTKKLSPVRRTALERLTIHNCEFWPDMCRPRDYYRDAVTRLCRG